jgi:hypothetical protein
VHFIGTEIEEVVASNSTSRAYRVTVKGGTAVEEPIPARALV